MSGRITVIVPVYNGEKHLSCCLASITGQTWTDLEILLVNDGSRDDSLRICRQWAEYADSGPKRTGGSGC